MMNKHLSAGLMCLLMTALITACGGKGDQDGNNKNPEGDAGKEALATPGPAELVFYTSNGDDEANFNRLYGDALRKKFPQFTIKYILSGAKGTSLEQLLTTETRFDIFMQGPGFYEAQAFPAQFEYDMTALIKKYNLDLNRLDKSAVDYVKQSSGGKHYFLPIQLEGMVLYYNKALFDKFGVAYPTDGMTWDEMMERSKRLTRLEDGIQYFGFSANTSTIQGMNPLSIPLADMTNDTPTINKDERWRTFYDLFYKQPQQAPGYLNAFKATKGFPTITMFAKDQNIAMFPYQSGLINVWEDNLKAMNWDIVALPAVPGQKGIGSMATPKLFGITKLAQNKDAAMVAIQYLLSDEHQKVLARMGIVPVLTDDAVKKELGKDSVFKDKNWPALVYHKFAPLAPRTAYYSQLNSIYQKYFLQAAMEQTDLNTALRSAEEESIKAIADFKKK